MHSLKLFDVRKTVSSNPSNLTLVIQTLLFQSCIFLCYDAGNYLLKNLPLRSNFISRSMYESLIKHINRYTSTTTSLSYTIR